MAEQIHFTVEKADEKKHGVQLKEAQEKLYDSEEYFKTIVESSFNGIAVTDEQGNFEYVNESFLKMVDWPKEELIGKNFIKIIPEDLHESVLKICSEVQEEANNCQEIKIKTRNSELKYLNSFHKLTKINGKLKTVSITEDITGKKKLEQELRESEAKYRELFENAQDAIFTSDAEGYIITANNAMIRGFGCNSKDEIIGTHFTDCLTPQCIQDASEHMRKYLSGEPVEQPVIREVICKNGEYKWAEVICRTIKDGDRAIGLHCTARDITEKIKMQRELKESEAKYRELFENAQDAMYVLDTEGNFLKMNQIGLRILGCTKEEVIGTNISKWLTQESLKIVEDRRKKRRSGEIVNQTDTLELVSKNGEHRWVEIKTRHIKDGGRTIEIHGIARDITENIILKQELKNSNKQRKLLCYLIKGTRGGKTRTLILRHLTDRSYNAHQLAKALDMDYKTVRHHLGVLVKNGIITRDNDGHTALYFLSKNIQSDLNEFNREFQHDKS
ncbi:PAS domain S-box protein [Candidatus Methanoperedens nitratireducens]|uniref:PAS domain S-box n=1 Tax=Candidatus Methanoperedens nitratireducens TaxID=1392998 RepID=A0A284VNG2_9EURY|nr:PAS domain S-box protein [Candidatus Methanoperedens nitroreducens]SNQ60820.1 hypothetical protein MNV_2030022 [Candidatus Methanoperedens nitroreducens]